MSSPPVIRSSSSRARGVSVLSLGPYVGMRIRATSAAEEKSSTISRVARRMMTARRGHSFNPYLDLSLYYCKTLRRLRHCWLVQSQKVTWEGATQDLARPILVDDDE
eukprot:scaffold15022_cov36-Cyclotella_meneghiniana.AAC.2